MNFRVRVQHGPPKGTGLLASGALFAHVVFMLSGVCSVAALEGRVLCYFPGSSCWRTLSRGSGSLRPGESLVCGLSYDARRAGQGRRLAVAQLSAKEQVVCVTSYLS